MPKFLIFHKFCSFWSSCVPTFLYGRLHRERRKTERKKFLYVLHHLRPYNTERRNFFQRNFNNINFHYAIIKFFSKVLQFLQQLCTERLLLQGQITQILKRKTAREKRKNVCFPSSSPAAHYREREKKYCVRNKNETVFKFLLCRNF